MKLTQEIARAAAADAANRQMRGEGRKRWNEADYSLACETFNRLIPIEGTFWAGRKVDAKNTRL